MKKIPVRHIAVTRTEPDFNENFSIRDIQTMLNGKDMLQELHRHDFFFVLVLKKGMGTHEIDFTPYEIGNNTVFLMRPGQVHKLRLKAGSTGWLLQFKPGFFYLQNKASQQLLVRAGNKNYCKADPQSFKKLRTLLDYILNEYNNKEEGCQDAIRAGLGIFFIELIRNRKQNHISPGIVNVYAQEQLEKFFTLLETHITSDKQVSQYAAMLHLSIYQLNAVTKALLDKTASEVINEYILLESKRQLLATTLQVNQVADQLGYEDVSYFIRFFKKHSGYSPEAYRQKFR